MNSVKKQTKPLILWLSLIIIISIFSFYPTFPHQFTNWDDDKHVTRNLLITALDWPHLEDIFTTKILMTYIPLTILSYAIEYHFFKLAPFIYHLNNLLLHLGVVGLIFYFARKIGLTVRAAGLAALLFALHPVHVESVAWVSGRKDVLYSLFYLLALINYWSYLEKRRVFNYSLSIVFGLLSLLAKAMALSLPFLLLLCDWFYERKDTKKIFLEKLPYILYILPLIWITYSANTSVMRIEHNAGQAILILIWTFTFYIKQFFFPFDLSPLYVAPEPISLFHGPYLLAVLIFIACLFLAVRFRKNRWIMFCFLLYFFSIFYLLRFERLTDLCVVADRYMYLPSLGFCLLIGRYLDEAWLWCQNQHRWTSATFTVAIIVFITMLSLKTNLQGRIWKDNFTFWASVIERQPGLSVAYANRGIAYKEMGLAYLAIKDYSKAIELKKDSFEIYYHRGNIYMLQGRYDLAIKDFNKSIEINSRYAFPYNNRGSVYNLMNNYVKALEDFDQAIRLSPTYAEAYYNRANTHYALGKIDLALNDYNSAIQYQKSFWSAYLNRASVYNAQGRHELALKDYSYLIEHNPQWAIPYYHRSTIFAYYDQFEWALSDALKAKSLGYPGLEKYIAKLNRFAP